MPVVELLVSAILPVLLEKLTSPELVQFLRQEGLSATIQKWKRTLLMIQSLLADAEEKQLSNNAVKLWLEDLQELAYDAEDMLDEFDYEACARKMKMDQLQASKFWKLVPASLCNWSLEAIKFRIRMRSQVKAITTRFDELCEFRNKLGLQEITGGASSSAAPQRPPTSSLRSEPAVYGRDEDKKKILEMVLKNEPTDANLLVIPIVGMGGVGKTTLAREVYQTVVESFDVKAWVCVSDGHFDVARVSMSILKDITGSAHDEGDFNTVQNELKKKINGKKFLLVLDDVWSITYVNWETLRSPFMESALGSRVIVTTRNEKVASTFTLEGFHPLGALSDEDCWLVFLTCMLEKKEAILARCDSILIKKEVTEKCKGLPLAAKTLAGLLRSKQIDEWLRILNSKLWNLSENDGNEIPTTLKLSYHHLPSHLRRCFAYCAIFPEDYEFHKEELVLLWIGEGLVKQSTPHNKLEDLGRDYFDDLLSRSMFQQSSSKNNYKFVMHDLVHDLAEWAFGELSLRLEGVLAGNEQSSVLEKVRHFSYTSNQYDGQENFSIFQKAKDLKTRIRTFLPFFPREVKSIFITESFITNTVLVDLLPKLRRLKVLSLQSYCIAKLPISIGDLKHLRYLNLSRTPISSLPESTCLLYNLQILMLSGCIRLKKLPSNFKSLIKLCHLDIKYANQIKEMPSGMKELTTLQNLSNFIMGNGVGSDLKDLMSLKMLRGGLCISGLDNVINYNHEDLILSDKDLKELSLEWGEWGFQFHRSQSPAVEEKVLDALQPHGNLEKLTITGYCGTKFPSWLGDASYSNMTTIRLKKCEKCTFLPSLGQLISLKELSIERMKGLKNIGYEFYGKGHSKPFQSLETLCFGHLPELVSWEAIAENEHGGAFPCLRELSIRSCPKLSILLDCPSLEKLVIYYCKQLVVSLSRVPKLCELEINACKKFIYDNPVEFKSMKYLSLSNISEFSNQLMDECFRKAKLQQIQDNISETQLDEISLGKPIVGGLQSIRFLTELCIEDCSNIVSFPEVSFLPHLSKLEIKGCNALTSLPDGMKHRNACLESLEISSCHSLAFIVRGILPPSLKRLEIDGCEKLETLWDDKEQSCISTQGKGSENNTNSCLLEELFVRNCPSLTCLSSINKLPATLKRLKFERCPQLTSIAEGFHNNTSLGELSISCCENLQIPKGLCSLSHLLDMEIDKCPSIECFPEEGLADTNIRRLQIRNCEMLRALPKGLRSINSLENLTISNCRSITSFNPEEDFPTNLKDLYISECVNVYRPLVEWGLHKLTSLRRLSISGCPDVEWFPQHEMGMMLPPSLTELTIRSFPKLKHLWSQGFQNLTSLQSLSIHDCADLTSLADQGVPPSIVELKIMNCPNFTCFPKQGLPSSLEILVIVNCPNFTCFPNQDLPSSLESLSIGHCPNLICFPKQGLPSSLKALWFNHCPKLTEECKRNKGKEWSKISNIPSVKIDGKHIYEVEEDEEPPSSSCSRSCFKA